MNMSDSAPRILVTGANGQVGWELMRRADKFGVTAVGTERAELDITDAQAVDAVIRPDAFDVVVNAAAYTAVDKAESEPDKAYAVNRDCAAHLASACARANTPLIHISTDYVFNGTKQGAYVEDDPVNPINVYCASKAAGEQAVRERWERHIILRTSWVYGVHGHNFVKTILRLARERDELRVVADQWGCPTAAGDIAEVILQLVRRIGVEGEIAWGTYHYCGEGKTTWYGFADAIVAVATECGARKVPIRPITTEEFPTPAERPRNSVLNSSKVHNIICRQPRHSGNLLAQIVKCILLKGMAE